MGTRSVTAFAPGGVGNVGPGLDILGLAVAGVGDTVTAEWVDEPGLHVREPGHPDLPREADKHTAALAARAVLERAGWAGKPTPPRAVDEAAGGETRLGAKQAGRASLPAHAGIALSVQKGLPLSGGQGGSAASAVAGAVAVNALLGHPLNKLELIDACLAAEEAVAGRHADNIAPQLLGGIVLIRSVDPLDVIPLPVPPELFVVLARPDQRLRTAEARAVLPRELPRAVALHQAAQVAAVVAALATNDYALLGRAIDDRIAEPARAPLLPGFPEAKRAALEAGALGSSISGAGPTVFALARGRDAAERVAAAMRAAYASCGLPSEVRVTEIDREGARVIAQTGEGED